MQERTTTSRLLLTIPEAALALGIGRSLCYELVLRGELPSIKLGRARRIPVASLEAFVARRAAEQ
jgi:excisionase family DNA binding protein